MENTWCVIQKPVEWKLEHKICNNVTKIETGERYDFFSKSIKHFMENKPV